MVNVYYKGLKGVFVGGNTNTIHCLPEFGLDFGVFASVAIFIQIICLLYFSYACFDSSCGILFCFILFNFIPLKK